MQLKATQHNQYNSCNLSPCFDTPHIIVSKFKLTWLFCFKYWCTRVPPGNSDLPSLPSEDPELSWEPASGAEELCPRGINIGTSSSTGCPKISRTERVASRTWTLGSFLLLSFQPLFAFFFTSLFYLSLLYFTFLCIFSSLLFKNLPLLFYPSLLFYLSLLALRHETELGLHTRSPPSLSAAERTSFSKETWMFDCLTEGNFVFKRYFFRLTQEL